MPEPLGEQGAESFDGEYPRHLGVDLPRCVCGALTCVFLCTGEPPHVHALMRALREWRWRVACVLERLILDHVT